MNTLTMNAAQRAAGARRSVARKGAKLSTIATAIARSVAAVAVITACLLAITADAEPSTAWRLTMATAALAGTVAILTLALVDSPRKGGDR